MRVAFWARRIKEKRALVPCEGLSVEMRSGNTKVDQQSEAPNIGVLNFEYHVVLRSSFLPAVAFSAAEEMGRGRASLQYFLQPHPPRAFEQDGRMLKHLCIEPNLGCSRIGEVQGFMEGKTRLTKLAAHQHNHI